MSDLLIGMFAGAGISLISVLSAYWMFSRHQSNQNDMRKTAMEILNRIYPDNKSSVGPVTMAFPATNYSNPPNHNTISKTNGAGI